MTAPQDEAATAAPEAAYRSRWRRFSPSMGWKAFWSEIVIVVLGVVIALAANEAASNWSWHSRVQDGETRLQGDITWVFLWEAELYVSQPCVDAQLAALSRNVLESGDVLKPQPVIIGSIMVQYVVRMPNRPYRFPVWDALVADGSATHFAPERQAYLGRVSDDMAQAREYMAETRRLMGRLLAMRDPIALTPEVRADLLTKINELRFRTAYEALNAQQRMRRIVDAGDVPNTDTVELFLNASGRHPSGSSYSGMTQFCTERGLPIADWRDYRKITVSSVPPGMGIGK